MNNGKQLSNSYSTGGGGVHFENRVQASFVVLMLTGGFSPCLPTWPIVEIKLQGKYQHLDTDDLIIHVKQPGREKRAKLLGQIKHTIKITKGDKTFGEVIQASWNDFNNPHAFTEGTDAIALITGPLSAADTDHVRMLLKQAQHSKDADDFNQRVSLGKFTSDKQREKLDVFKTHLKSANHDITLTYDQLWRFLKSFHLLIYDLDIKGVTHSLLHSLIGQYSEDRAEELLALIEQEVTFKSENAGYITIDALPDNIRSSFERTIPRTIPQELVGILKTEDRPNWNNQEYASTLAATNLLGACNEQYEADKEIVASCTGEEFAVWTSKIREILLQVHSPISLINGVWTVSDRKQLWHSLGTRIFDEDLELFKQCAIKVLKERDPKFFLSEEKRFASSLYGKVPKYSESLRKGIIETLVMLGCDSEALSNCSLNKAETIAILTVREIFEDADWMLWASLNYLLPVLAEAVPKEFLTAVETTLNQMPCPFDHLFAQEGGGITGTNYLTGLLWSLETLAWDEQYLVRVTVILGELATRDPGGNWANRPSNSLSDIFLPWFPQTTASVGKRKVAVETLSREVPEVGWNLLISLLPNQRTTSSGTHKPQWRKSIPEEWASRANHEDYVAQVSIYAEMAVEKAKKDLDKLAELVAHLDHLPPTSLEKVLEHIESAEITGIAEEQKINLWTELIKFISRHKRFADAKWALSSERVAKIENAAEVIAPINPLHLNRILFSNRDFDLFEERGNWQEQREQIEKKRQTAINNIFKYGGVDAVIEFVTTVESPSSTGFSLGFLKADKIDSAILPNLLNTHDKHLGQFVSGFIKGRQRSQGWEWVDKINTSDWTYTQIGQFLAWLPFTEEIWERANVLLVDSQAEYWSRVNVNPYETDGNLEVAIDKLIEYDRPKLAIDCLYKIHHNQQPLDKVRTVRALLAAISSDESSNSINAYEIVELIEVLQDDPDTNVEDLFQVEWAYLPLLDSDDGASPKLLENRLASDSAFFCDVIRSVYRSKHDLKLDKELSGQQKAIAENAYRLLDQWRTPPGMQADGTFSGEYFRKWLELTKVACEESGHLEVALSHIGKVLFYCPPDPDGMWIHRSAAEALNEKNAEGMRRGFRTEVYNSRGVHWIDPTGTPERELAAQYRNQADEVENAGFQRFADTLRGLADSYDHEAEQIIAEQEQGDD